MAGARLVLAEAPAAGDPKDDALAGRDGRWRRTTQRGDGLGERLAGVFTASFADGAEAVVIVNSDSPALPPEYLEQAFAELEPGSADLVLGPAADGGYYLIGAGRRTWDAGAETITRAARRIADEQPADCWSTRCARRRPRACRSRSSRSGWTSTSRPTSACSTGSRATAPLRGEPLGGLREVYLHVTHRCGRACRHCYDARPSAAGELTTAEWRDAIDQCVALGARSFVFIGGDPLVRDDFVELVDHITGRHEAKARFFFNCLIDEALAGELAPCRPRTADAAGEHRRPARGQRRAARPAAATTT